MDPLLHNFCAHNHGISIAKSSPRQKVIAPIVIWCWNRYKVLKQKKNCFMEECAHYTIQTFCLTRQITKVPMLGISLASTTEVSHEAKNGNRFTTNWNHKYFRRGLLTITLSSSLHTRSHALVHRQH